MSKVAKTMKKTLKRKKNISKQHAAIIKDLKELAKYFPKQIMTALLYVEAVHKPCLESLKTVTDFKQKLQHAYDINYVNKLETK